MKLGRMILGIDANIQHALMCARKDIDQKMKKKEADYSKLNAKKEEYYLSEEYLGTIRGTIQGLQWALDSVDDIRQSKSYRNRIKENEDDTRVEFKNQEIGIQHEGNTAAIDCYSVKTMRFEWEDNKELQKQEDKQIRKIDADELIRRITEIAKRPSIRENPDICNGLCCAVHFIYDMLIESGQEKGEEE